MNIFTVNQVNQVYVLKANSTVSLFGTASDLEDAPMGSVVMGSSDVDGSKAWFIHKGAGGITKSDIIEMPNLLWAREATAESMRRYNTCIAVKLNSEVLNGSSVIPGDYTINIKFQNPVGMSPDNQYWKFGAVRAIAGMTETQFLKAMKESIDRGIKRDAVTLLKTEVDEVNDILWLYGVTQDWIRGIKQVKPVIFTAECSTIDKDGVDVVWGDFTTYYNVPKGTPGSADYVPVSFLTTYGGTNPYTSSAGSPIGSLASASDVVAAITIKNGTDMADYEYFYMGERGDQYRLNGWPNYIPTEYLIDPSLEYNTYAIHFAYTGSNHAIQKSEKEVTFLVPTSNTSAVETFSQLIGDFNTNANNKNSMGLISEKIDELEGRVEALEG